VDTEAFVDTEGFTLLIGGVFLAVGPAEKEGK